MWRTSTDGREGDDVAVLFPRYPSLNASLSIVSRDVQIPTSLSKTTVNVTKPTYLLRSHLKSSLQSSSSGPFSY